MPEENVDKDFGWLINIVKALGALAASLSSLAVIFVIFGYTIVISFLREKDLYGLAYFPREFFMEADLQFLSDFADFFAKHIYSAASLLISVLGISLCLTFYSGKKKWKNYSKDLFFALALIVVFLFALNLENFPDDWKGYVIYSLSLPLVLSLALYLAVNFRQLRTPAALARSRYIILAVLFLLLAFTFPVNYGRFRYDLNVYEVNLLEFEQSYSKSDLFEELRKNISEPGGSRYFLMGHTEGKDIFFLYPSTTRELVMIDSKAMKLIGLSGKKGALIRSLRALLDSSGQISGEQDKGNDASGELEGLYK